MMIFQAIFISQTMGPWISKFELYFSCFRHRKDWVCRIDVRRTFGISPNKVSVSKLDSAVEREVGWTLGFNLFLYFAFSAFVNYVVT